MTAGHDNYFNQSYPLVFERRMKPIFDGIININININTTTTNNNNSNSNTNTNNIYSVRCKVYCS